MKTAFLAILLVFLAIDATLRAGDVKYPPINPALLYWQAAAELPHLTADQAKEVNGVASGERPFEAAKLRDLPLSDTSLRMLEKAATSPAVCDWGIMVQDGPMAPLPHLAKIREMSNLALVNAERLFAEGKIPEGTNWLLNAHRIARHAGAGDLLITNLVQNAIETNAIRAAARRCLGWDDATRHTYLEALKNLPPLHTVEAASHGELMLVDWLEARVDKAQTRQDIEQLMQIMQMDKAADRATLMAQTEPAAMRKAIADWRAIQKRLEVALGKPWVDGQEEIRMLMNEAEHNSHFLVKETFPFVSGGAEKWHGLATLRTMLDAALEHGAKLDEKTAAAYRDSLEGEPLRLTKTADGGFTLTAAHPHPAGKELVLKLGK